MGCTPLCFLMRLNLLIKNYNKINNLNCGGITWTSIESYIGCVLGQSQLCKQASQTKSWLLLWYHADVPNTSLNGDTPLLVHRFAKDWLQLLINYLIFLLLTPSTSNWNNFYLNFFFKRPLVCLFGKLIFLLGLKNNWQFYYSLKALIVTL